MSDKLFKYSAKEVNTIIKILYYVMTLILIIGFVGGIAYGVFCEEPTEAALEAMEKLEDFGYSKPSYLEEKAMEKEFGTISAFAMFTVWICTLLGTLLIYIKTVSLKMMLEIVELQKNRVIKKVNEPTSEEVNIEKKEAAEEKVQ